MKLVPIRRAGARLQCRGAALPQTPPAALPPAQRLRHRLQAGVLAEREEQRSQVERLHSRSSRQQLKADGRLLTELEACPEGRLYGELLWRFELARGQSLPTHQFKPGNSIFVRTEGWQGADDGFVDATVVDVQADHMMVTLQAGAADALLDRPQGSCLEIGVGLQDATSKRQLAALDRLEVFNDPARRGEKLVRAIVLGSPQATRLAAEPPEWMKQLSWRDSARALLSDLTHLNDSQRAAVAAALVRTCTLWQGPPGTGKTRTLLGFLELVCRMAGTPERRQQLGPILAVADTNAAADNLLQGMLGLGIGAVRVGQPSKVRPELRHACLDALAEDAAAGRRSASLRDKASRDLALASLAHEEGRISATEWRQAKREASTLWARADRGMAEAVQAVLCAAPVVVATCAAAGEARLQDFAFKVVVVDEATQATEPSTLVPLVKGAECVVFAGDHKQLPPTVISPQALQYELDVPLFSRLQASGMPSLLLDTQYRMHPAISIWPSRQFYAGRIQSGVTAADRPPLSGVPWPTERCPVLFVPCEGPEEWSQHRAGVRGGADGASYHNVQQADVAIALLGQILQDRSVTSCAILTPYNGQVKLMAARLTPAQQGLLQSGHLVLSTVDGFQGREADAVILSTVRCNPRGKLGFVSDVRRMNVALTRARRGLLVVGSAATLRRDANWAAWLAWVKDAYQLPPGKA